MYIHIYIYIYAEVHEEWSCIVLKMPICRHELATYTILLTKAFGWGYGQKGAPTCVLPMPSVSITMSLHVPPPFFGRSITLFHNHNL